MGEQENEKRKKVGDRDDEVDVQEKGGGEVKKWGDMYVIWRTRVGNKRRLRSRRKRGKAEELKYKSTIKKTL